MTVWELLTSMQLSSEKNQGRMFDFPGEGRIIGLRILTGDRQGKRPKDERIIYSANRLRS